MKKILQQKGYPDSTGKVHKLLIDAQKAESRIDLFKAIDSHDDSTSVAVFIDKNPDVVREYMKYNCPIKKAAPKKKATAKK